MYRYGYTSTHKQRWRCKRCHLTRVTSRPDIVQKSRYNLFIKWLTTSTRLEDIAKTYKVSRQTIYQWFQPFWQQELSKNNKKVYLADRDQISSFYEDGKTKVIILDATYIKRKAVILIAKDLKHILGFGFYQRENYQAWLSFFKALFPNPIYFPDVVVIDGKKGLTQAANEFFEDKVKIQRCLFHLHLLFRGHLSSRPETQAGKELKLLIRQLSKVKTKSKMHKWLLKYFLWFVDNGQLLEEKTISVPEKNKTNRLSWHYTNKKLRATFNLLRNALPYLFTFLDYPSTPRTTNHVEAGINSRLKELIHKHRGLSLSKQRILIKLFLQSKMPKTTRNFT